MPVKFLFDDFLKHFTATFAYIEFYKADFPHALHFVPTEANFHFSSLLESLPFVKKRLDELCNLLYETVFKASWYECEKEEKLGKSNDESEEMEEDA